jgi:hypothetical protein
MKYFMPIFQGKKKFVGEGEEEEETKNGGGHRA